MLVLALDTSSPAVTAGVVAVGTECTVVAERSTVAPRGHGELLTPAVDECLTEAGVSVRDLTAIVAGVGPGPYTGLRVGLVTAAALSHALDVPAYGVCSLDAIAADCADEADLLVATDARRREVYFARYAAGARVGDVDVARPADVPGAAAVAGGAVDLYPDAWPTVRRRPERYPSPAALVRLARDRIESGALEGPLVPMYLRRPDAVVPGAPKTVSQ